MGIKNLSEIEFESARIEAFCVKLERGNSIVLLHIGLLQGTSKPMPVYTYRRADGTTFEYRQKFSDAPLQTDPTTGQEVKRIVQAAGIIFKGSGFYVTDTKGANKSAALPADAKTDKSESTSTSAAPAAEAATPAKSDSASAAD